MTEPTYTIKPLEWVDEEGKSEGFVNGQRVAHCYGVDLDTRVHDVGWFWFADFAGKHVANVYTEKRLTREQCKAASESAYRRLLAEHLVEVK